MAIRAVDEQPPPETQGQTKQKSQLSGREAAILSGLVQGASNKMIACQLKITEATVKVHVKAILRKIRGQELNPGGDLGIEAPDFTEETKRGGQRIPAQARQPGWRKVRHSNDRPRAARGFSTLRAPSSGSRVARFSGRALWWCIFGNFIVPQFNRSLPCHGRSLVTPACIPRPSSRLANLASPQS